MKDANGNIVNLGDCLRSSQSLIDKPYIQCVEIKGNTATMEWLNKASYEKDRQFKIKQSSLKTSCWIKEKAPDKEA